MLYQLVNGIVSTDGQKAIILGINIDQETTTVTVLDISSNTPTITAHKIFNKIIKSVWTEDEFWNYIEKDGGNWDSNVSQVKNSWDLEEVETKRLDIEYFDFAARLSPSKEYLALSTFKGNKVKVFSTQDDKEIGSLNVENTPYCNGISFSDDSNKLGYIAFDQAGGNIMYAEKQEGEFKTVFDLPKEQISDDYSMNGIVNFDNEDLIATTVYTGSDFEFVKYNKSGDVIWKETLSESAVGITDTEQMTNLIWNQLQINAVVKGKLYTGAGRQLLILDTKTGKHLESITFNQLSFIHQVLKVPQSNKLLLVDIFGIHSLYTPE